jgi:Prolyl oligopeptidase family
LRNLPSRRSNRGNSNQSFPPHRLTHRSAAFTFLVFDLLDKKQNVFDDSIPLRNICCDIKISRSPNSGFPEYGSSDDPRQFEYLRAYSPYHQVKAGVLYPAVLFMTAESDTRVDPMHAVKMAALCRGCGGFFILAAGHEAVARFVG